MANQHLTMSQFLTRDDLEAARKTSAMEESPDPIEVLEKCKVFLRDLTDPDRESTGSDIIACFANAISLRVRVVNALAAAKALSKKGGA
jgi:hypothetical protein